METKQRDATFDTMKGIGILLVLIGHVWVKYIPVTAHIIYSFHMPLFFLVAGYRTATLGYGGRIRRGADPFSLPRVYITQVD